MHGVCVHCLLRWVHRNRLCFVCEFSEPRRARWYALRPLPTRPTDALPGSLAKVAVFEQRRAAGTALHHPRDRRIPRHLGPVWELVIACQLDRIFAKTA
ncbi:hypothetical protein AYO44_03855 [Planctomycetaceae bacterium SCGC AG-212-F19]|nr:hypothetical protein AYO44_03855 [Planctomycetaceae bacterium SCGC AG-212-F19]